MGKYDPLYELLTSSKQSAIELSFENISELVGGLPASAYQFPWWWKNDIRKNLSYIQSEAWRVAGYRATPDLNAKSVVFRKITSDKSDRWHPK